MFDIGSWQISADTDYAATVRKETLAVLGAKIDMVAK